MTDGIYTLANDVVYDQLIALLNSIEVNLGPDFPVCVIPYDDRQEKIIPEIQGRKNVQLLDNREILNRWEDFSTKIWEGHPNAFARWQEKGVSGVNRMGMHRRFCSFDSESPFERFIFLDADILVLNSFDYLFEKLAQNDVVVYDFQYKDPTHVYDVNSPKLLEVFNKERIESEIFCAGLYASTKGLFPEEKQNWLLEQLNSGESEILYLNGPDQSIINYMMMRSQMQVYNFSLHFPPEEKTGCSVTSPHFEYRDNLLYDKGVRLTYLHYIGVSSKAFTRVCAGENLDFPYREIFLNYRYLHEPEKKPKFIGKPKPYNPPPSLIDKIFKKIGLSK